MRLRASERNLLEMDLAKDENLVPDDKRKKKNINYKNLIRFIFGLKKKKK